MNVASATDTYPEKLTIWRDEFFVPVGDPVDSRSSPPPALDKDEQSEACDTKAIPVKYRTGLSL